MKHSEAILFFETTTILTEINCALFITIRAWSTLAFPPLISCNFSQGESRSQGSRNRIWAWIQNEESVTEHQGSRNESLWELKWPPSACSGSGRAQECSPSAQVKAAAAQVQTLKQNQRKSTWVWLMWKSRWKCDLFWSWEKWGMERSKILLQLRSDGMLEVEAEELRWRCDPVLKLRIDSKGQMSIVHKQLSALEL